MSGTSKAADATAAEPGRRPLSLGGSTLSRAVVFGVLGAVLFVAGTAVIRGQIERRSELVSLESDVETATDDVLFGLELQADRIAVRLAVVHGAASARLTNRGSLEQYWSAAREAADFHGDETLVLTTSAGEVVAAAGALARDPSEVQRRLRQFSIVGRAGGADVRSGLVDTDDCGLVAVSLPIAQLAPKDDVGDGDVALSAPRISWIAPVQSPVSPGQRSAFHVELWPLAGAALPEAYEHVPAVLWRSKGRHIEQGDDGVRSFRALADASGRHAFLLVVASSAPASGLLPSGIAESLAWELLAALFGIAVVLRVVKARLVDPVNELEQHASRLTRTEHGKLAFHSTGNGEVGSLSDTLDLMLNKVESDRVSFVRSARIAGMSDVSMGVVHSAGNILNSVNVSTKLLAKDLAGIGIDDLRAMIAELDEHKDNLGEYITEDPNGRFLLPFLSAMTDSLSDLQTRCMLELEAVDGGVAHVIDLIRSQEKYAIGAAVIETVAVEDVIEQALSIATLANERSGEVDIDRAYSEINEVRIDRHKLTSVLINIIANAIEALTEDGVADRRLELALYPMTQDRFVLEILDTGVGIAPEHLDAIFTSSFSTKQNSPGQGLHTTANLCKELGIAIGAVSEGVGLGCTFKLRIPYDPPEGHEPAPRARETVDVEAPSAALPRGPEKLESETA